MTMGLCQIKCLIQWRTNTNCFVVLWHVFFILSHLTLSLQISDLLLLKLHVHAELLAFCLQLSDATSKGIGGLHSVAQMRKNCFLMSRNSWYNYEEHADSTRICTLLQLPKLQLWLQWPPPSSSSSSPPPAASQPELGLPAQPSASSPVGISSAYPSA